MFVVQIDWTIVVQSIEQHWFCVCFLFKSIERLNKIDSFFCVCCSINETTVVQLIEQPLFGRMNSFDLFLLFHYQSFFFVIFFSSMFWMKDIQLDLEFVPEINKNNNINIIMPYEAFWWSSLFQSWHGAPIQWLVEYLLFGHIIKWLIILIPWWFIFYTFKWTNPFDMMI